MVHGSPLQTNGITAVLQFQKCCLCTRLQLAKALKILVQEMVWLLLQCGWEKNNFAVVPLPNYLVPLFIPSSNKYKDANSKESVIFWWSSNVCNV